MDECTASNNSSLDEKKTWLVIETSEPQAEKEVDDFCCPAQGWVAAGDVAVGGHRLG